MNLIRRIVPAAAGFLAAAFLSSPMRAQSKPEPDPWSRLPAILAAIKPPVFPDLDCPITKFGAKPDGVTEATVAFRRAIAECSSKGGGRVVGPPGVYLSGPIHLKSSINLHIQKGATVRFSTDPSHHLPVVKTRFEGIESMGYSPLIYAHGQENIAITGEGTLDGQASDLNWWKWKGRTIPMPGTQRAQNSPTPEVRMVGPRRGCTKDARLFEGPGNRPLEKWCR